MLEFPRNYNQNWRCSIIKPEELKKIQAPIKEKYQEEPEAALVTLSARGKAGEGVACNVETGKGLANAGLHPATGGAGETVCSGDMLLEALVACAGVTLQAVATNLGIELRDATIEASGELDVRGTLGVSKEAPVGFKKIQLHFDLDIDASEEQVEKLIKLTDRFCVVKQTLDESIVDTTHNIGG